MSETGPCMQRDFQLWQHPSHPVESEEAGSFPRKSPEWESIDVEHGRIGKTLAGWTEGLRTSRKDDFPSASKPRMPEIRTMEWLK